MKNGAFTLRTIGFILSLLLTLATYFIVTHSDSLDLNTRMAIIAIFALAILQSMVQFFFFLNVWHGKGALWNVGVFLSTVGVIFIVVFFSIWVMDHLNYNMIPTAVEQQLE